MDIRHFNSKGKPIPAPDPDSYDEGSGTLVDNKGPGIIERWFCNSETGETWFTRTPTFGTLEEAEAYIQRGTI